MVKKYRRGETSLRWQYKLFLTLLPLPRKTTNNYSRTRYHWDSYRGEAEHPLIIIETKTECNRKVREAAIHWLHCPSPGQGSTMWRSPLWDSGSFNRKREPRWETSIHPHYCESLCGSSYFDLTAHCDFWEICRAQPLGIWLCQRMDEVLLQSAHGSWKSKFILAVPSNNLNQWLCLSGEPRLGHTTDQWTQHGADLPDSDP